MRTPLNLSCGSSNHIRAIAKSIPARQLITETDNPGGPREIMGEPGYPALVVKTIDELARIRHTTPSGIAETVQDTWLSLVKDDPRIETPMSS
jgi:Tat protein secretion system quality control protein TatD with DNase activity